MFWISHCGTQQEAKEYIYTIKIESYADEMAGRTQFLLTGTGECLSCEVSHEDVKQKPTVNRVTCTHLKLIHILIHSEAQKYRVNGFAWQSFPARFSVMSFCTSVIFGKSVFSWSG